MSHHKRRVENPEELETQFIMRLPSEPAKIVKDLIRSGASNLKDRVTIRLENNVRYGEVRVDNYLLPAKVVDLPTVVESLKTIDNKSFYKTADISQMLICKDENDRSTDEEMPSKKKDQSNKVDKKFLWPHGITPPTKCVRSRRFRKTLKKKFVEDPETEKELKRILRTDNDAVSVEWEIVNEEVKQEPGTSGGTAIKKEFGEVVKVNKTEVDAGNSMDVVEQEIFGGAISDSDDDNINFLDINEGSRLSIEQDYSRMYESSTVQETDLENKSYFSQFSKSNDAASINFEVNQKPGFSGGTFIKKEIGGTLEDMKPEKNDSMDVDEDERLSKAIDDSDDEINVVDSDESSRLNPEQDDSRMYESDSVQETQFCKSMFEPKANETEVKNEYDVKEESLEGETYDSFGDESLKSEPMTIESDVEPTTEASEYDRALERSQELKEQLEDLIKKLQQREIEIASLENNTLRRRFENIVEQIVMEMHEKQMELGECEKFLSKIKKNM